MITEEIKNVIGSVPALQRVLTLMRFPISEISIKGRNIDEALAKAVWLVVPIQFYVLTRFPGGFTTSDYVAAVALALLFVLAIFIISGIAGLIPMRGSKSYENRTRKWSIALLITWTAALSLLAMSYVVAQLNGQTEDFFGRIVCTRLLYCSSYPSIGLPTFITYAAYSVLAVTIIAMAIKLLARERPRRNSSRVSTALSMLLIAILNAILMTALHGLSVL